ncbi:NDE1, mitochondrial external NADH dehydrogenase [Clavulina sp. PMI_390]|nr:NDE1, mitochondrial external NADH dehydrogenase [Clavulina sp. PMI_390]
MSIGLSVVLKAHTPLLPRAAVALSRRAYSTTKRPKEKLVILGSGWGGFNILKRVDKSKYDVTLISPSSYFNMTPLLAGTAVGTLEFRTAIESVQRFSPQATIYEAWGDRINFADKTIYCTPSTPPYGTLATRHSLSSPHASAAGDAAAIPAGQSRSHGAPFKVPFDKLVVAVGAYSQTFGIPGVKENVHFLKDVRDARAIRMRVLECFTQASQPNCSESEKWKLLNFVVVGGGPTGVEFAAELHDLCKNDMQRHYPHLSNYVRITIYETSDKILGAFDEELSRYASERFRKEHITVKRQHRVQRVRPFAIEVEGEGWVPFGMCVWSTGLAPNPLLRSISELKKDERTGSLITDGQLRVLREGSNEPVEGVWAIGDASAVEGPEILPATAQVAAQKALYLVKHLNNGKKAQTKDFKFISRGNLAYLGDWTAIYDASKAGTGPQTRATGRTAWLIWRSAYVSMAMSPRNMLNIPWYWFTNWIFGRDLSRF